MILQAQDIISAALGLIGAVAIDETPTTSELTVALRTLNIMIDAWSARHLLLRSSSTDIITLSPGVYQYTIGPIGATITKAKPIKITSAFIRDSSNTDDPLEIITLEQYNAFHDKAISSGRPTHLMYDPGVTQQTNQVGTIAIYLIPDQTYMLTIESDKYLTEFSTVTDTVTLEPAYYEPMVYNLAVRLFRQFHGMEVQIPLDIAAIAQNSLRTIETMNSVTVKAGMDLPGKVVQFNIFNDSYYSN